MSLSDAALPVRAEHDTLAFTFDDRHWRVRGLENQLSCERLKVNLLVSRQDLTHIDTVDLYTSRQRRMFLREAAAELYVDEALLKRDLGRLLLDLEARQEMRIKNTLQAQEPEVPQMTEAARDDALALLKDPQLIERILADYETCGLVGEATNKLLCYLVCVSRLLERPLAVLVQSSSAAGKTSLLDATLRFMPVESQACFSALTGQSLYYMGRTALKHKILAVAEEDGVAQASYALKLLQSDRRLRIASAEKDRDTGRQQTRHYEVEGPVALLLTTTAEHPDGELANRCLTLSVNEHPHQTTAIHQRQRANYQQHPATADVQAILARHQHAQRLLEPLPVLLPFADQLTFRSDQTRHRREHAHYLSLIAAVTLLHQYRRKQITRSARGQVHKVVVATLEDLELANRLMRELLRLRQEELLPQTRQLWWQLNEYVTRRANEADTLPPSVRFTQRQLREALGWQDRTLRRHLRRLVDLEYVVAFRAAGGNGRVYQLVETGGSVDDSPRDFGLVDVDRLRPMTARPQGSSLPRLCDSAPSGVAPAGNRHPSGTPAAR